MYTFLSQDIGVQIGNDLTLHKIDETVYMLNTIINREILKRVSCIGRLGT